jgi:hypothetical protein
MPRPRTFLLRTGVVLFAALAASVTTTVGVAAALTAQHAAPGSYVSLNPQPLPPGGAVSLNPQPLPPKWFVWSYF